MKRTYIFQPYFLGISRRRGIVGLGPKYLAYLSCHNSEYTPLTVTHGGVKTNHNLKNNYGTTPPTIPTNQTPVKMKGLYSGEHQDCRN